MKEVVQYASSVWISYIAYPKNFHCPKICHRDIVSSKNVGLIMILSLLNLLLKSYTKCKINCKIFNEI